METQRAVPLHTSGDKGGRSAAGATHSQQPSEEPEAETVQGYLVAAQRRLAEEQKRVGRPSEMSKVRQPGGPPGTSPPQPGVPHLGLGTDAMPCHACRPHHLLTAVMCRQMTASELEEEKSFIKYELKRFDDLLGAQLGRSLKKADKEPMRPLYSRYHEIKNVLSNMVPNPAGTSTTQPAPVEEYTQDLHILQVPGAPSVLCPVVLPILCPGLLSPIHPPSCLLRSASHMSCLIIDPLAPYFLNSSYFTAQPVLFLVPFCS